MKKPKNESSEEKDALIEARVNDAFRSASNYVEKFVGFLDPHEAVISKRVCEHLKNSGSFDGCSFEFFGGCEGAQRVFLGVFPPYCEHSAGDFPIVAVKVKWRFANLSHRDFLGALLALGIEKSKIGDIIVGENECTVFLEKKVSPFVLTNITKVGSAGVNCEIVDGTKTVREDHFKEIKSTIASSRLDCVVSALTGSSRSAAVALIEKGLVSLNFEQCFDSAKNIVDAATVSIRGHGRFDVEKCEETTRKGRLIFSAKKYL